MTTLTLSQIEQDIINPLSFTHPLHIKILQNTSQRMTNHLLFSLNDIPIQEIPNCYKKLIETLERIHGTEGENFESLQLALGIEILSNVFTNELLNLQNIFENISVFSSSEVASYYIADTLAAQCLIYQDQDLAKLSTSIWKKYLSSIQIDQKESAYPAIFFLEAIFARSSEDLPVAFRTNVRNFYDIGFKLLTFEDELVIFRAISILSSFFRLRCIEIHDLLEEISTRCVEKLSNIYELNENFNMDEENRKKRLKNIEIKETIAYIHLLSEYPRGYALPSFDIKKYLSWDNYEFLFLHHLHIRFLFSNSSIEFDRLKDIIDHKDFYFPLVIENISPLLYHIQCQIFKSISKLYDLDPIFENEYYSSIYESLYDYIHPQIDKLCSKNSQIFKSFLKPVEKKTPLLYELSYLILLFKHAYEHKYPIDFFFEISKIQKSIIQLFPIFAFIIFSSPLLLSPFKIKSLFNIYDYTHEDVLLSAISTFLDNERIFDAIFFLNQKQFQISCDSKVGSALITLLTDGEPNIRENCVHAIVKQDLCLIPGHENEHKKEYLRLYNAALNEKIFRVKRKEIEQLGEELIKDNYKSWTIEEKVEVFKPFLNSTSKSIVGSALRSLIPILHIYSNPSPKCFLQNEDKLPAILSNTSERDKINLKRFLDQNDYHHFNHILDPHIRELIKPIFEESFKELQNNNNSKMNKINQISQFRYSFLILAPHDKNTINAFIDLFQNYVEQKSVLDGSYVFIHNNIDQLFLSMFNHLLKFIVKNQIDLILDRIDSLVQSCCEILMHITYEQEANNILKIIKKIVKVIGPTKARKMTFSDGSHLYESLLSYGNYVLSEKGYQYLFKIFGNIGLKLNNDIDPKYMESFYNTFSPSELKDVYNHKNCYSFVASQTIEKILKFHNDSSLNVHVYHALSQILHEGLFDNETRNRLINSLITESPAFIFYYCLSKRYIIGSLNGHDNFELEQHVSMRILNDIAKYKNDAPFFKYIQDSIHQFFGNYQKIDDFISDCINLSENPIQNIPSNSLKTTYGKQIHTLLRGKPRISSHQRNSIFIFNTNEFIQRIGKIDISIFSQWLENLTLTCLKFSPSRILNYLYPLALNYPNLRKTLLNIAFFSVYQLDVIIPEKIRNSQNCKNILNQFWEETGTSSTIHTIRDFMQEIVKNIIQTKNSILNPREQTQIIELVEFMERANLSIISIVDLEPIAHKNINAGTLLRIASFKNDKNKANELLARSYSQLEMTEEANFFKERSVDRSKISEFYDFINENYSTFENMGSKMMDIINSLSEEGKFSIIKDFCFTPSIINSGKEKIKKIIIGTFRNSLDLAYLYAAFSVRANIQSNKRKKLENLGEFGFCFKNGPKIAAPFILLSQQLISLNEILLKNSEQLYCERLYDSIGYYEHVKPLIEQRIVVYGKDERTIKEQTFLLKLARHNHDWSLHSVYQNIPYEQFQWLWFRAKNHIFSFEKNYLKKSQLNEIELSDELFQQAINQLDILLENPNCPRSKYLSLKASIELDKNINKPSSKSPISFLNHIISILNNGLENQPVFDRIYHQLASAYLQLFSEIPDSSITEKIECLHQAINNLYLNIQLSKHHKDLPILEFMDIIFSKLPCLIQDRPSDELKSELQEKFTGILEGITHDQCLCLLPHLVSYIFPSEAKTFNNVLLDSLLNALKKIPTAHQTDMVFSFLVKYDGNQHFILNSILSKMNVSKTLIDEAIHLRKSLDLVAMPISQRISDLIEKIKNGKGKNQKEKKLKKGCELLSNQLRSIEHFCDYDKKILQKCNLNQKNLISIFNTDNKSQIKRTESQNTLPTRQASFGKNENRPVLASTDLSLPKSISNNSLDCFDFTEIQIEDMCKINENIKCLIRNSKKILSIFDISLVSQGTFKELHIFGTDKNISHFLDNLEEQKSNFHPVKFSIISTDGKKYDFLLKPQQDLRLDERINQFFKLLSQMLHPLLPMLITEKVFPLTANAGVIQWLNNCPSLSDLISQVISHKDSEKLTELFTELGFKNNLDYQFFMLNKYVKETPEVSNLLRNCLWQKAFNTNHWIEMVSNFTKTTAIQSMAGYVAGIGDRHLQNIMISIPSGSVVHIDFGDCFDRNRKRAELKERVPFRLTRNIVSAFGPCGIHGTFTSACRTTLQTVRDHADDIYSLFTIFKNNPLQGLKYWYARPSNEGVLKQKKKVETQLAELRDKINGNVFVTEDAQVKERVTVEYQLNMLIKEATDPNNLYRMFIGWCPQL